MSVGSGATLLVCDSSFEHAVLLSDRPALVSFATGWCMPCRKQVGEIDALAEEYEGRAIVARIDVDGSPMLRRRYGVRSLPTTLLIHRGEVVARRVGLTVKRSLAELLERALE